MSRQPQRIAAIRARVAHLGLELRVLRAGGFGVTRRGLERRFVTLRDVERFAATLH